MNVLEVIEFALSLKWTQYISWYLIRLIRKTEKVFNVVIGNINFTGNAVMFYSVGVVGISLQTGLSILFLFYCRVFILLKVLWLKKRSVDIVFPRKYFW